MITHVPDDFVPKDCTTRLNRVAPDAEFAKPASSHAWFPVLDPNVATPAARDAYVQEWARTSPRSAAAFIAGWVTR